MGAAIAVSVPVAVRWDRRLRNWAKWSSDSLRLGYDLSVFAVPGAGFTPDEQDAGDVERLMLRLKKHRRPLYRALWQAYIMRRDDISAADALRVSVQTYHARISAAYAALEMYERSAFRGGS